MYHFVSYDRRMLSRAKDDEKTRENRFSKNTHTHTHGTLTDDSRYYILVFFVSGFYIQKILCVREKEKERGRENSLSFGPDEGC